MHHNYEMQIRAELHDGKDAFLSLLEDTQQDVWVSNTTICHRKNIIGVPSRRIDVLIDHDLGQPVVARHDIVDRQSGTVRHPAGTVIANDPGTILEIGIKVGRFDGYRRPRITLRRALLSLVRTVNAAPVVLLIEEAASGVFLRVATHAGGIPQVMWELREDRLRWRRDEELPVERLVGWHWARYYRHLPAEVIKEAAELLGPLTCSLTEANRRASRELYRIARERGWHKLTLREQNKLHLSGQWHSEAEVATARAAYRGERATGCGDFTHAAASGLVKVRV